MQPDIVKTHPYIDRWRVTGFQYFVVPKAMLRKAPLLGLGMDDVVLYVILRDRANLSGKNKWVDKDGHVYIIFTREQAAKYAGWSLRKTIEVFGRLVDAGLLQEVEQKRVNGAMNRPKLLYVKQWVEPSEIIQSRSASALMRDGFPYLTEANISVDTGEYYILPRCLFEDPIYDGLTLRAIMLYVIALDKLSHSITYGRVDDDGRVWCSLGTETICNELGCCDRSARAAYKELEQIGLLERKRNGGEAKTPYRIYLRDYLPVSGAENPVRQNLHPVTENSAPGDGAFCTQERQDMHAEAESFTSGMRQNLPPSNPFSQPSLSTLSLVSLAAAAAEEHKPREKMDFDTAYEHYQLKLEYPILCDDIALAAQPALQEDMFTLLDLCIEIMAKDASARGLYIRMGNETAQKDAVLDSYDGVDRYIMFVLLERLAERKTDIKNMEQYAHRALIGAAINHAGSAYYTKRRIEELRSRPLG